MNTIKKKRSLALTKLKRAAQKLAGDQNQNDQQDTDTGANPHRETVVIDHVEIERVEKFTYLGGCFNEFDDDVDDIDRRVQQGNVALARIRKILWNRNTPRRLKMKMVMTFVYPTVTYAEIRENLSQEVRNCQFPPGG